VLKRVVNLEKRRWLRVRLTHVLHCITVLPEEVASRGIDLRSVGERRVQRGTIFSNCGIGSTQLKFELGAAES